MKTALVTGATGAIGVKICEMLASQGFYIYIHYNKNRDAAVKLQGELETRYQVKSTIVSADLSRPEGPQHLLKQLSAPIDILIYNCGAQHYGLLTDFTDQSINETMQLHLLSAISVTRSVVPAMIRKKAGKVVMISSVWGEVGAACETVYSAAKGGLNSFVKALSKELAPSGIQVNSVSPGVIATPMLDSFSEMEKSELESDIPAGRFGEPDEVAHAVEFLISTKADYISGHILSMNGSWFT
ncbi:elongation factor P 5-aminopentanone reductase [Fictibacillus phosphorivorans]|uniref:elongation factor P 5-aminopentanone reductase n=1 Tax=Fictibacillus phosphorivorans TaxID=1221500 RepID=UPI00203C91C4|nr:SDR family NAD(P)-dependent oxidoreductase [Fictibacillus phosphorivorans]MCM3717093.1 SDR family NAD(P)-dependent oxidoreductase [Fictibacillus phosphorivorans]MCM3774780.1 SDR family NAD(P)-dependent oxidoreductase [Fictibacillus phosphorivorans]